MSQKLCFLGLMIALTCGVLQGEEQDKFCIRTEPILLAEIEKRVVPVEVMPNCETVATIMTPKEKESFMDTMCKDHGTSHKDDYYMMRIRHGDLSGRESYRDICSGTANPLMAWIPYDMIRRNYVQELNPKERLSYIAKATDVSREKTELCHFHHADLVNAVPDNLFSCVVMIFEDNFYGLDSNIQVLVELLPIMYEIRNITYMPWVNSTASYKTKLGQAQLKNPSRERKQIYSSLPYSYIERVHLNTSSVYSKEKMERLPLLFEHKDVVLELNKHGVGGLKIEEKAYFGHTMDGKSSVQLEVVGQWASVQKQFHADIYEYFGFGVKRFRNEMHGGQVAFMRIDSTEPVFEMPDSANQAKSTVFTKDSERKFERLQDEKAATTGEWDAAEATKKSGENNPYPSFYPWFVLSVLIFGMAVILAIGGVVTHWNKKEHDTHEYKLTPTNSGV